MPDKLRETGRPVNRYLQPDEICDRAARDVLAALGQRADLLLDGFAVARGGGAAGEILAIGGERAGGVAARFEDDAEAGSGVGVGAVGGEGPAVQRDRLFDMAAG